MSLFSLFSSNCDETEEYLESLADFLESVLQNELRTPIDYSTDDTESQAVVLTAYVMLASFGISRENPNVNVDCEGIIDEILRPRLKKWASVARSSNRKDRLFQCGMDTIAAGEKYKEKYEEGMTKVWEFAFLSASEDSDEKIPEGEFASLQDALFEAEATSIEAISRHDSENGYQSWIDSEIAREKGEQYAKEMADRVKNHLRNKYQIRTSSDALNEYEEAVVGIFYLCSLVRIRTKAGEGGPLLSTSVVSFKRALEGLPDDGKISVVANAILISSSPGQEEAENIVSWAIAHSRNREFSWGDDWTGMDYSGRKSLMSALDDALNFHGV